MSETKLLEMKEITKAFASNVVLNGVNLSVGEGEVVAILGENGAGKSTLIKILGGIHRADSGEIRIGGGAKQIHSAAVAGANGIRIIHQEIILVPGRTIAANVFLGRELKNKMGLIDAKKMEAETQKVIDELAGAGVSIIMVSSELPEIINMCNRCYVMCEGRITGELAEKEFSQEAMMALATKRETAEG